jgi:hypothetical protein
LTMSDVLSAADYQVILDAVSYYNSMVKNNVVRYSTGEMAGKYPMRLLSYSLLSEKLSNVLPKLEDIVHTIDEQGG